jgi:hypothetical protein
LLGYTPPNYFLAHNTQQEFTLHNFADIFGQPKNVLILALAGFGVFLPLARHWKPLRTVVERVGATLPSVSLMPWFAAAIVLLVWYPVDFTGEWVETLAGGLFLVSSPLSRPRTLLRALAVTAATGVALAFTSSLVVNANPAMLSCAHAEARALISDIEAGFVTYDGLLHNRVHKRIRSAVSDAYMAADLRRFRSAHCEGEQRAGAVERRRFAIDPWGLPYWVRSEPDELGTTITVYSFGPNRRRDNEPGQRVGDDVMRAGRVPAR